MNNFKEKIIIWIIQFGHFIYKKIINFELSNLFIRKFIFVVGVGCMLKFYHNFSFLTLFGVGSSAAVAWGYTKRQTVYDRHLTFNLFRNTIRQPKDVVHNLVKGKRLYKYINSLNFTKFKYFRVNRTTKQKYLKALANEIDTEKQKIVFRFGKGRVATKMRSSTLRLSKNHRGHRVTDKMLTIKKFTWKRFLLNRQTKGKTVTFNYKDQNRIEAGLFSYFSPHKKKFDINVNRQFFRFQRRWCRYQKKKRLKYDYKTGSRRDTKWRGTFKHYFKYDRNTALPQYNGGNTKYLSYRAGGFMRNIGLAPKFTNRKHGKTENIYFFSSIYNKGVHWNISSRYSYKDVRWFLQHCDKIQKNRTKGNSRFRKLFRRVNPQRRYKNTTIILDQGRRQQYNVLLSKWIPLFKSGISNSQQFVYSLFQATFSSTLLWFHRFIGFCRIGVTIRCERVWLIRFFQRLIIRVGFRKLFQIIYSDKWLYKKVLFNFIGKYTNLIGIRYFARFRRLIIGVSLVCCSRIIFGLSQFYCYQFDVREIRIGIVCGFRFYKKIFLPSFKKLLKFQIRFFQIRFTREFLKLKIHLFLQYYKKGLKIILRIRVRRWAVGLLFNRKRSNERYLLRLKYYLWEYANYQQFGKKVPPKLLDLVNKRIENKTDLFKPLCPGYFKLWRIRRGRKKSTYGYKERLYKGNTTGVKEYSPFRYISKLAESKQLLSTKHYRFPKYNFYRRTSNSLYRDVLGEVKPKQFRKFFDIRNIAKLAWKTILKNSTHRIKRNYNTFSKLYQGELKASTVRRIKLQYYPGLLTEAERKLILDNPRQLHLNFGDKMIYREKTRPITRVKKKHTQKRGLQLKTKDEQSHERLRNTETVSQKKLRLERRLSELR